MNRILLAYIGADFLFLVGGILLLVGSLVMTMETRTMPTLQNVPHVLLFDVFPRSAALANSAFVFFAFLLSIPGILLSDQRFWLKIHGYLVVVCAIFTLVLGVRVWYETLKTGANLGPKWAQQTSQVQSLLQQRFDCCGYLNSTSPPFVQDATCPSPLAAAQKPGCIGPFSNYADLFLDYIFTADFGLVAIDAILLLNTAVLLKDRKERERYRLIDAKNGLNGI